MRVIAKCSIGYTSRVETLRKVPCFNGQSRSFSVLDLILSSVAFFDIKNSHETDPLSSPNCYSQNPSAFENGIKIQIEHSSATVSE